MMEKNIDSYEPSFVKMSEFSSIYYICKIMNEAEWHSELGYVSVLMRIAKELNIGLSFAFDVCRCCMNEIGILTF